MDTTRLRSAQRTLIITGWLIALSGLLFSIGSQIEGGLDALTALVLPGAEMNLTARVYAGVCGGLTAAFGVTQARSAGLLDGSIHPLRPFLDGVLAWFVIDTSATVALGATANAVGNAAFLLLLPGPVWLAMRAMQWKPRAAKDSTRATSLAHSGA